LDNNGADLFVVNSDLGIFSSSTQPSLNSTTGSLVFYGGVSIHNTSNAVSNVQGGALTVAGGASFRGDIYVDGNIYSNNIGGENLTGTYADMFLSSTNDAINSSSGALVVDGGISIKSSSNSTSITNGGALLIVGGASIGLDVYIGGNLQIQSTENAAGLGTGGSFTSLGGVAISKDLLIGGNVGINNTNPSCALDVGGDIFATGNVTSFSDARVKTDIVTISHAIQKVNELRGVYYTHTLTNRRNLGLIAQEVQTVLPEAVMEFKEDGYLGVAYGNIIGLLIEAIKELSAKVNNQCKC
jgi:hypothetical protein